MKNKEEGIYLTEEEKILLSEAIIIIDNRKSSIIPLKSESRKKVVEKILKVYNLPFSALNNSTFSLRVGNYSTDKLLDICRPICNEFKEFNKKNIEKKTKLANKILSTQLPDLRAIYQLFTGSSKSQKKRLIQDYLNNQNLNDSFSNSTNSTLSQKTNSSSILMYSAIDLVVKTGCSPLNLKCVFDNDQRYQFIPLLTDSFDIKSSYEKINLLNGIIFENVDTAIACIHNKPFFDVVFSAGGYRIAGPSVIRLFQEFSQTYQISFCYFGDYDVEGLKIFSVLENKLTKKNIPIKFYIPQNIDLFEITQQYGSQLDDKSKMTLEGLSSTIKNKDVLSIIEIMLEANISLEQNLLLYLDNGVCRFSEKE